MHRNTENLVIPNGNTKIPKFLYPENSGIPNSRKIPIPELQYYRRKKIWEWPLPNSDKPHKIWRERDMTWCINTWYDITYLAYTTLYAL